MHAVTAAALADAVELGSGSQERTHFMASALALLAQRAAIPAGDPVTMLRAAVALVMAETDRLLQPAAA